jgi:hypothetical protein
MEGCLPSQRTWGARPILTPSVAGMSRSQDTAQPRNRNKRRMLCASHAAASDRRSYLRSSCRHAGHPKAPARELAHSPWRKPCGRRKIGHGTAFRWCGIASALITPLPGTVSYIAVPTDTQQLLLSFVQVAKPAESKIRAMKLAAASQEKSTSTDASDSEHRMTQRAGCQVGVFCLLRHKPVLAMADSFSPSGLLTEQQTGPPAPC